MFVLLHYVSFKCITHLLNKSFASPEPAKVTLTEKGVYDLQNIAGYVVQKIYRKLHKSKHWHKDECQQCIQLVKLTKIEKTEAYKLVFYKDRKVNRA